jgi:hypothetical protein
MIRTQRLLASRRFIFAASWLLAAAWSAMNAARADIVPTVSTGLWINGSQASLAPATVWADSQNPAVYDWSDSTTGSGFTLVTNNNSASLDPFVTNNVALTNNTGITNNYTFTVTLPVPAILTPTVTGGSVGGSLTGGPLGGTLTDIGVGSALYTAIIDGVDFHQLLPALQSVTAGAFLTSPIGPDSFGLPGPFFGGPAVTTSIAIRLDFSLSPGAQASFTSVFVVQPQQNLPEPGTLTLMGLALAGLAFVAVGRHKRRRLRV